MANIATLGPTDPFCTDAVAVYRKNAPEIDAVETVSSIKAVFKAVGNGCSLGIVPIENMIDGHVVQVLELLLQNNCTIIDELVIPARYGCIGTGSRAEDLHTLYTTYRSRNECSEFIATFPSITLLQAADYTEALAKIADGNAGIGALVPAWTLPAEAAGSFILENVNDYTENATRFIVIAAKDRPFNPSRKYKTSMVILEANDRPGALSDILSAFSSRGVNLSTIISRPTRIHIGTYHFFVDCTGHPQQPGLQAALAEVRKWGHVKLLGSYPMADASPANDDSSMPHDVPSMRRNPFRRDPTAPPCVAVVAGRGPYRNTIEALAGFDLSPVKGRRVLLKPNIGRIADASSGVITNHQVIAAAIDAFRAAGAAEVAVGDSPITGVSMGDAFEKSGIGPVVRERGCRCIDMDKRDPVEITVRDATAIRRLKVCADVFDFDIIVSMPVMKMHMHTMVTLSIKNMKGCLWRRSKVDLHMLPRVPFSDDKSLNIAIADMASVLRPHMAIIDGTIGMEGLGPSAGEPKQLDLVIVGDDPYAADSVACTIMGIDPENVPHLRIAQQRGYGNLDTGAITINDPAWKSLCRPFAPVPQNITIQFPRVTILDEQSCSACQSTVLLFMKRYAQQLSDYYPDGKQIHIAIGKGHQGVPPNTICIGNCTRRFRDAGVYIPGCPPVASSIMLAIEKQKGSPEKP
jgi:prephenate dehydratase/uncharacterized protein (DUF362 family)